MSAYILFIIASLFVFGYFAFNSDSVYRTFGKLFSEYHPDIRGNNSRGYQITALEKDRVFRFIVIAPNVNNALIRAQHVCPSADSITAE
jgi:hypothetical protein